MESAPALGSLSISNMTGKDKATGKLKKENEDLKNRLEEAKRDITRPSEQVCTIRQADNGVPLEEDDDAEFPDAEAEAFICSSLSALCCNSMLISIMNN